MLQNMQTEPIFKKVPVGIITWHYYPNFGSSLQAYALHSFINRHGGDASLINYVEGNRPEFWRLRLLLGRIDAVVPRFMASKLHYRFLLFEKQYFRETKIIRTRDGLEEQNCRFSKFICGSDQIWAPNVFNDVYFLSFVKDNAKKYSYAASIGLPRIPDGLINKYKVLLDDFNMISVREYQAQSYLKDTFGIDSELVLDPTLLITSRQWREIAISPKTSDYLLCYFLGQNEGHRKIASEIAKSLGLKIICLSRFDVDKKQKDFVVESDAGPREFVGYVNNADIVITDSFHGLCFSINLSKQFYVFPRFPEDDPINQNSRITNLLSIFGLEDRLISSVPGKILNINFGLVNDMLEIMRKKSASYLKAVINK